MTAIALAIAGLVLTIIGFFLLFVWSLCRMAAQTDAEIEYPSWLPEPREEGK